MFVQTMFVYGTLKRGQSREMLWPHPPVSVEFATVRGTLFDLGPYPALLPGDDVVRGEAWHFDRRHVAPTLAVVDRIEGFDPSGESLYVREMVYCRTQAGNECRAYTYYYAHPIDPRENRRVRASAAGFCEWGAS